MTNTYFNHASPFARFTTADAVRLNSTLKAVESGFDKLPSATELSQGSRNYSVATNTGNAYSITVPWQVASYTSGLQVTFLSAASNTSSATLSINGLPPATIRRFDGTNLLVGDIRATSLNSVVYDGTAFRMISMHGGTEALATTSATSAAASATSAATSAASAANSANTAVTSATTATSAASTSAATLSASRFGLRNLLINSQFWVSQWIGSTLSGTTGAGVYIRDRWKTGPSGATWSIANSILTITAGSVQQIVQGRNLLYTGDYTLSWTGTAVATINGTSISNGGKISLPGTINATVSFSGGTVFQPQLEYSPVKTQFEVRPMDLELLICYQYFQKSYDHLTVPGSITGANQVMMIARDTTFFNDGRIPFTTKMRGIPLVTLYSVSTGLQGTANAGVSNERPVIPFNITVNDVSVTANTGIGGTLASGFGHFLHWTADAEL